MGNCFKIGNLYFPKIQKYNTDTKYYIIDVLFTIVCHLYSDSFYLLMAQVKEFGLPRRVIDVWTGLIIITEVEQKASTW